VAIDSAGHKTQAVYDFCGPRLSKKIYPIISKAGPRKIWTPSKSGSFEQLVGQNDRLFPPSSV